MFSMFKSTTQTTIGRDLNAEQLTQVTGGCAKTVAAPPAKKPLAHPHLQPAPIHHVAPAQPQAPAKPTAPACKPAPTSGC